MKREGEFKEEVVLTRALIIVGLSGSMPRFNCTAANSVP
jgi:hypothetical protein